GQRRGIPVAVVQTVDEVAADPHLAARGFWRSIEVPGGADPVRAPGPHYRFAPGGSLPLASRTGERGSVPPIPEPSSLPLAGVRVLDFTWVLAGPFGSRVLADLGADVIKVEPRGAGDGARWNPPFQDGVRGLNRGGLFNDLNHNKRDLSIDLKDPRGLAIARRLATEWADVLIENFAAGTLERMGLDPAELTTVNPLLSVIRLSAFGQTGPYRDLIGYAPPLQALAGLTAVTGYPPDDLMGVSLALGDYVGGLSGALTCLASLFRRAATGRGSIVDVSQFEGAARLLGPVLLDYAVNGRTGGVHGNRDPLGRAAPHGVYPVAGEDRWIALTVASDAEWTALRRVMGDLPWARDPRLDTAAGRVANVDRLDQCLSEWTRGQDASTVVAALQAAGVAAAEVQDNFDLLRRDPHLAGRGYFRLVDHPDCGPVTTTRLPVVFSTAPPAPSRPAPLLGEHNEEILCDILGLTEAEIDDLILSEVI
ncbi:MAG TPA: CoA transferase, partial [Dehalococcoidia bacterium]|nr:CoA transferase [Dehalococcoidia bacterium]